MENRVLLLECRQPARRAGHRAGPDGCRYACSAAAEPHGQAPRSRLTFKTDARSRMEFPSLEALLAGADILFANLPA